MEQKETSHFSGLAGARVPSPWAEGGAGARADQSPPRTGYASATKTERCIPVVPNAGPEAFTLLPAAAAHVIFLP